MWGERITGGLATCVAVNRPRRRTRADAHGTGAPATVDSARSLSSPNSGPGGMMVVAKNSAKVKPAEAASETTISSQMGGETQARRHPERDRRKNADWAADERRCQHRPRTGRFSRQDHAPVDEAVEQQDDLHGIAAHVFETAWYFWRPLHEQIQSAGSPTTVPPSTRREMRESSQSWGNAITARVQAG
jgi:hypothetical protein